MPMARLYTITMPGGAKPQGDCPKWAKDFEGSPSQHAGATIESQPVLVVGPRRLCNYCAQIHTRILPDS